MGLFKKKESKELLIVKQLFDDSDTEMTEKIYYGNYKQAYGILTQLLYLTFKIFNYDYQIGFKFCFEFYIDVWVRKHGGLSLEFTQTDYIKGTLKVKFSNISPRIIDKMVDKCVQYIYINEPEIEKRDNQIGAVLKMQSTNISKNKNAELASVNHLNYGLVPEMPIFVNGFGNDKKYLAKIGTESGNVLSFFRTGSIKIDGISGPVDEYIALTQSGEEYGKIYLCNYGESTPTKTPNGYSFLSESNENHSSFSDLEIEFQNVVANSQSAPIGNENNAWNWIINKIQYFREAGIKESRIDVLIGNILLNLTTIYSLNFEQFISEICDFDRLINICINLKERPEKIKEILQPCLAYVLKLSDNISNKEKCFLSKEEYIMYLYENETSAEEIIETNANYTLFILVYCNVLNNILCSTPEELESFRIARIKLLSIAEKISPTNAIVHYELAKASVNDVDKCISESRKALLYAIPEEDNNILIRIYDNIAMCYINESKRISMSFYNLCKHYGATNIASEFVLNTTDVKEQISINESIDIIKKIGIQIGYSELAISTNQYIKNNNL